jgi:hypothetical protein
MKQLIYQVNEGFVLRELSGESVVIYKGKGDPFDGIIRLNEEGTFVWKYLKDGTSKESMIKALISEYDEEEQQMINDLDEVLNNLISEGVVGVRSVEE